MHATMLLAAAALTAIATPAVTPAPQVSPSADNARCRDTIDRVRNSAGKPALDRSTARPGEATAWFAVDKRVDKCRVLVPVRDPTDIRLQPAPSKGPARFIPGH